MALVDLLPLVGGLLAGVPVVIIAAIHSVPAGIIMLVIFLAYQQVENHILNPVIMSKTVRLNPFWVLIAVLVGATLGGKVAGGLGTFVGALIGIPVGGALQVIVRELRRGPDDIDPLEPSRGTGPAEIYGLAPAAASRESGVECVEAGQAWAAARNQVGGGTGAAAGPSWRPGQGGGLT